MASSKTHLSTRGDVFATPTSKIPLLDVVCDLWHPETNPGGYVSLGVAENVCFRDIMVMFRWFRIVFAHQKTYLQLGLDRMIEAVDTFRRELEADGVDTVVTALDVVKV